MNGGVHGVGGGSPGDRIREERYRTSPRPSYGRPSGALVSFAEPLPGGTALDLACSRGDDAIWLANRGCLESHRIPAARPGEHLPKGRIDLVSAPFLHSPVAFPRTQVVRAAARTVTRAVAQAVAPGGLLLIVEHASVAPWSWAEPDTAAFPTPEQSLAALDPDPSRWHSEEFVGAPERLATGPGGQRSTVPHNGIAPRGLAR